MVLALLSGSSARCAQPARRATRLILGLAGAKLRVLAPTGSRDGILVGSLVSAARIRAGISGAKGRPSLARHSSA